MAEAGTVAAVGVFVRAGGRFQRAGARHKEKVSQVGDAGTAEVRKAESHDGGLVVFVAGRHVVVEIVGVGADLDAAEGNLRAGIDISEAVSADEGIDIVDQALLCIAEGAAQEGKGDNNFSHSE